MRRRATVFLTVVLLLAGMVAVSGTVGASHLNNTVSISGEIPFSAPSGPTVTLVGPMEVNMTNMFPTADTVRVWSTEGNITVNGSSSGAVTVDEINGTWTNTSSLSVIGAPITMDPGDKSAVTVSGDITQLDWHQGMAPDDGTPDFVYSSSLGSGSITLNGLPANTEIAAVDPATNTILDIQTTDGSGTATYTGLDSGTHTVELMTSQGGPVVNDASANPTGQLANPAQTLSIDVSDADFPNDEVTVEFFVDGSSIGTDTLTADGTATQSHTFSLGGSSTWHVQATDEYGQTDTSATFNVQTPNELQVFNESAPTELVDNATVELRFYVNESSGTPQIFERNTTTGTINMTGLPADEPFIVVAEADGYYSRRIFVPSLFETQRVYLLPENATAVPVVFGIEDYTGNYPQDNTVLQVERALNGSYQTVLGDYFGATGQFPATLAYNQRHRLVLLNVQTGEERILGTFTPQVSSGETVTVSPSGDIEFDEITVVVNLPEMTRLPPLASVPFNASILNASQNIQSWTLTLSVNGTTIHSASGVGESTIDASLNLSAYPGQKLTANMTYTLGNGLTDSRTETYTIGSPFTNDNSLISSLRGLLTLVPPQNQAAFGMFITLIVTILGTAGIVWAFPMSSEFVAVVAWLWLAVFAVLGFISYDLLFVAGVLAAALAYLRRVG